MIDEITKVDAVVSLVGGDLTQDLDGIIRYNSGQTPPSDAEIDAEVIRLQSAYDDLAYSRNRVDEYPTIAELTISLFDDGDKAALVTKRAAVKKKWPKDNSGPIE
jgi:hypothetical protein